MATREEINVAQDAYVVVKGQQAELSMGAAIDAIDARRARTLDGPGGLIEIGRQAYAEAGSGRNGLRNAIRAVHAHMQGAPLGYVVRWAPEEGRLDLAMASEDAFAGPRQVGRVFFVEHTAAWAWWVRIGNERVAEGAELSKAAAQRACEATIAEYMKGFGLLPTGTYDDGFEAARKAFAALVRDYKRDASFDDSALGAAEHQANQENIARAIEGAALKRSQHQEAGRS